MKNSFEREGQRLIEDFERALKAEKAKNIRTKRIPERELRTTPHIEPLFQRSLVTSPRIAILEQLGDTDYIYRFKIRNHATPVTITQDIPKVYKTVKAKLSSNWPQTRTEHQQRADFWAGAVERLSGEAKRLYALGELYIGGNLTTHGAPLSGGYYPHWPQALKDRIRFAVEGRQAAQDALRLHQTILKQRSLK